MFMVPWLLATLVVTGVTMTLYATAYKATSIHTVSLAAALWSLGIAALLRLSWRHLSNGIGEDVVQGTIALKVRYPLPYLGVVVADHIGRSTPCFMALPFFVLFAVVMGGVPHVEAPVLSTFLGLLLFCGGAVLSGMVYIMLGLNAFWIENAEPVLWIFEKTTLVLGGSVIPLALLPSTARNIIEFTPFAATGFAARAVNADFLAVAPKLIMVQAVWLILFGGLLFVIWRKAVRRLDVNGG